MLNSVSSKLLVFLFTLSPVISTNMSCKSLPLTFIFTFLSLCSKTALGIHSRTEAADIKCIESERQALLAFKHGLIDEYDHLSSWGSEAGKRDCCKWRGVRCSNRTGRVVGLSLRVTSDFDEYTPLRGNINSSSSLLELQHLNYLDMSLNDFGDESIPEHIGSLKNLLHLNLSHAGFGGKVPHQLGNLSRLQSLDLSYNFALYADKLEWLSRLKSLRQIRFNSIHLAEASDWMPVISQLPFLTGLQLRWCSLPSSSSVSSSSSSSISMVNSSKTLTHLSLSGNNQSSSIYPWLSNFSTSLVDLDLSYNNLQGSIPDFALANMTSLLHLDLGNNYFVDLPKSFGNLCSLKSLSLNHNKLSGQLPELFSNLSGCTEATLEKLLLTDNFLSGSLPDFTQFSSLRELQIRGNKLNGSFPKSFRQISHLTKLYIGSNNLGGPIPDLSVFVSMRELSIHNNHLTGTFPKSIAKLSQLELLDVSSNFLEDMITEVHISNLSKLTYLDLSSSSLTLNFSDTWVPPFQLETIIIRNCKVGPGFPKWLQTQHLFSYLDISNGTISDTIPTWFWELSPNLHRLNISHNHIRGVLPNLTLKFSGYPVIDFSDNMLEGSIPPLPPNVTSLILSKNKFSGSISFLCGITGKYFSYLDISDNRLSGSLQNCSIRWQRLTIINLANNNFSGEFPKSLRSGCNVQSLHLRNNSFFGELPLSLTNCSWLRVIDIGNNKFSGKIPGWIGDSLSDLAVLSLRSNRFHGNLPAQLCNLAKLQVLDFSLNNITGTIPKCLSNLTTMSQTESSNPIITYPFPVSIFDRSYKRSYGIEGNYHDHALLVWKGADSIYKNTLGLVKSIDLSSNRFSGEIPAAISRLVGLISLNLSRNNLTGPIPPEFGRLSSLNSMDLSKNKLTGKIPENFSELNFLGVLDLSNNKLSGKIPMSLRLQSFDAPAYMGNPELCGSPLPNKCPEEEPVQHAATPPHEEDKEEGFTTELGLYISIFLGFFTGFWGVCGTLILKKSWRLAYFKFVDDTKDKLFAFLTTKNKANLRRHQSD